MKKADIIRRSKELLHRSAYDARIHDELFARGFDEGMQQFNRDQAQGKAFGVMQVLQMLDEKCDVDKLYEEAVEDALQDMIRVKYDTVEMLNLAGYDGAAYVKACNY